MKLLKIRRNKNRIKKESQWPIITDGLVVAGATAAIYAVTFSFEYGYLSYFGIPAFLIELSISNIVFAALSLLLAILLIVDLSHIPRELLSKLPWPRLRSRLIWFLALWLILILTNVDSIWVVMLWFVLVAMLTFFDYVVSLIFGSGSFSKRMGAGEESRFTTTTSWSGPAKVIGNSGVNMILLAVMALMVAHAIGTTFARFQKNFIVLESMPDVVVIKRYGDRLIATKYAGTPARFTGEVRIINLTENVNLVSLKNLSVEPFRRSQN